MKIKEYPKKKRLDVMEQSELVFSQLKGDFYRCVKNKYENTQGHIFSSDQVVELFNNSTKVSIEFYDGSFVSNTSVISMSDRKETAV